jgi:hypothetical protein
MRKTAIFVLLAAGCSGGDGNSGSGAGGGGSGTGGTGAVVGTDTDAPVFAGLLQGADQMKALCGRGHQDQAATGLCSAGSIGSLNQLQHVVGLFANNQPPQFALTGHSTSLVERAVSAINPRAIIFTAPSAAPTTQQNDGSFIQDPGFVAMGFVRGEQFVEIAAHDPQADQINFYLVRFTQACNAGGCTAGDLLTPDVENNWTGYTVYEDEDLKNTIVDCRHCHQPDGPTSRKILRMQERRAPWTHWFRNNKNEPGGETLLADFQAAHGANEDYAGIPASLLSTPRSDPLILEALIDNNTLSPQPNEFRTGRIEQEVQQSAPQQPDLNMPAGQSPTWQQVYANSVSGLDIPVPYHDVKITDPQKLAAMQSAYRDVRSGAMKVSSLPDIRDVLLDEALPEMSLRPAAGLDGRGILVHMCQRCHNSTLDQSLSRARFNVQTLDSMSRAEKDQAIARISMGDDVKKMPPSRFGQLSPTEIQSAVDVLKQ